MKRLTLGLIAALVTAVSLAGCSSSASTDCTQKEGSVTICLNGKPIDFSEANVKPHLHESGNIYAPVEPLAKALGLTVQSDANAKTASVGGKSVTLAATETIKGVHVHEGLVFVPLKEFAEAAGLKMALNFEKQTAGFAK